MPIIEVLSQYLDVGVDSEELRQIALASLAQRLRDLKLAIGEAVVQAHGELLQGSLAGADRSLRRACGLRREYGCCYDQWQELYRQEGGGPDSLGQFCEQPRGGEA